MRFLDPLFSFRTQNLQLDRETLRRQSLIDNFKRGRVLAVCIILFEFIFILFDIFILNFTTHNSIRSFEYFALYIVMIVMSLLYLLLASRKWAIAQMAAAKIRLLESAVMGYIIFGLVWSSVVTLIDQQLYNRLSIYMIGTMAFSVFFLIEWKKMLTAYLISGIIMLAGLPLFQKSSELLAGHYANLAFFILISWLASRVLYLDYCRDLAGKLALTRANEQLEVKSLQNQQINEKLIQANFQLKQLSLIDELTEIANRRGLRNFISQIFEQHEHPITRLSVIMLDIDNFKLYNDHYGHPAGDQVLTAVAAVLTSSVQPPLEFVARWGGEEFIFLSFSIDETELAARAEEIRQKVEHLGITHDYSTVSPVVTVSIGTSSRPISDPAEISSIIEAADMAMYIAKEEGRNQVSNGTSNSAKIENLAKKAKIVPVETQEQAAVTADLARQIWQEYYSPIIGPEQVEYMLSRFQSSERIWQDINEAGYRYSLVEVDGQPAAYMAVKTDNDEHSLFLSKFYIDQKYRQQGLGRLMLDEQIQYCRSFGLNSIWLTVNKNNQQSIAAYYKLGFVQTDSVVNDIGDGYVMDDFVMRLTIGL